MNLTSIDEELHELHSYLRDQVVTAENKRAIQARMDILLDRRHRLAQRAMIGK